MAVVAGRSHLRFGHRFWREFKIFLRNAAGSIVSVEFATTVLPLLVLWEGLPRLGLVSSKLVPPPSVVTLTAWDMLMNHDLGTHFLHSMGRFALGMLIALAVAAPIGILMGWNMFIRRHSLPLFQILAPIPPPAWVPMAMVLLGIGLPMQTFLIFLGAFYPVLFNTYQGVKDTDPRYVASARVFGASELTLIRKVYIWHAMGSIIMGIKIGIAMGLVMLVIAEMYGGNTGIGYILQEAKEFFLLDRMVVCMVILGFVGWFLIEVMKYVELKLAVWKVEKQI
ncbi:MAG: ABC transporter permease [Burkholderiaceae bacterium]|jgi:ABC-type nitrate/sulfonate/bicarbonate transport system permease component|nr:ABC transporter permease [Burkholderiaceae bacterium]